MRTIQEIYDEYRIPPWLQDHQVSVAAIGQYMCRLRPSINAEDVIAACLVHDIGAIVKFDFSRSYESIDALYPQKEIPHWIEVQRDFHRRYGYKEHPATDAIIEELGISKSVRDIVHNTGFENMRRLIGEGRTDVLIVQYADMRVGPKGVLPMKARIADVRLRYGYEHDLERDTRLDGYIKTAKEIEHLLFKGTGHRPDGVTDESMSPFYRELRDFQILQLR